jgi:hypothetical protein
MFSLYNNLYYPKLRQAVAFLYILSYIIQSYAKQWNFYMFFHMHTTLFTETNKM